MIYKTLYIPIQKVSYNFKQLEELKNFIKIQYISCSKIKYFLMVHTSTDFIGSPI